MKKRFKVLGMAVLLLVLALTVGENLAESQARKSEETLYQQLQMFSDVLSIVQKNYVEEVENKKLINGALRGMLSSLDPYSQFLEPELYKELEIETEGKFGGVGMTITVKDNLVTVVSPLEDTPAFRAGIQPNDRIIKIDGKLTRGMDSAAAAKLLRGDPSTRVNIEVLREGAPELLKLELTRELIKLKSVKRAQLIEGSRIGYIRLVEFQKESYTDLKAALETLRKDGLEGLVLDLRNNPGGLLDSSISIADLFLPPNRLVVYTQGRRTEDRIEYRTRQAEAIPASLPMVILVDEGSASASEILAGALSDSKRAVLVGKKSFGKGSVQTVIPLPESSAVKLTIARYYTPSGRVIEGKGLTPDIEVEQNIRTLALEGKIDLEKDAQLQRALDLLKGLTVLREK
ncbi:MAG TPA: S41 family peptidase [bacterium]|nr:S41 family peptidase [bacterium]